MNYHAIAYRFFWHVVFSMMYLKADFVAVVFILILVRWKEPWFVYVQENFLKTCSMWYWFLYMHSPWVFFVSLFLFLTPLPVSSPSFKNCYEKSLDTLNNFFFFLSFKAFNVLKPQQTAFWLTSISWKQSGLIKTIFFQSNGHTPGFQFLPE